MAYPVFRDFIPEQEFRIAAYRCQGSAHFMADGLHQVMTELQQLPVLLVASLQFIDKPFAFFLFVMVEPDFPVYGDMEQEQQENGHSQGKGEEISGAALRFHYLMLALKESFLHLPVQMLDKVVQPGVQCQIAGVQTVGAGFHLFRPFLLHGNQAVAECMQFPGGRQYTNGFLGAQRSQEIVPSFPHGTYAGGTFRYFGQVVDQNAVCRILHPDGFHDTEQVRFPFAQQGKLGI